MATSHPDKDLSQSDVDTLQSELTALRKHVTQPDVDPSIFIFTDACQRMDRIIQDGEAGLRTVTCARRPAVGTSRARGAAAPMEPSALIDEARMVVAAERDGELNELLDQRFGPPRPRSPSPPIESLVDLSLERTGEQAGEQAKKGKSARLREIQQLLGIPVGVCAPVRGFWQEQLHNAEILALGSGAPPYLREEFLSTETEFLPTETDVQRLKEWVSTPRTADMWQLESRATPSSPPNIRPTSLPILPPASHLHPTAKSPVPRRRSQLSVSAASVLPRPGDPVVERAVLYKSTD